MIADSKWYPLEVFIFFATCSEQPKFWMDVTHKCLCLQPLVQSFSYKTSHKVTCRVLSSSWSRFSLLIALSFCWSIFASISKFSFCSNSFFSNWWWAFSSCYENQGNTMWIITQQDGSNTIHESINKINIKIQYYKLKSEKRGKKNLHI